MRVGRRLGAGTRPVRRAAGLLGPVTRVGLLGRTDVAGSTCCRLVVTSVPPGTTRLVPSLTFVGVCGIVGSVTGELICGRSYLHEAGVLELLLLSEESSSHVGALVADTSG